ncbi:MAG TPA: hypothetical protein VLA27_08500 [Paracoccaceae bacterium]|nr:hypothetical protein [Paracoccaceae bacterium]
MASAETDFSKRLEHIAARRGGMKHGIQYQVKEDGTVVATHRRSRSGFPVGSLLTLVVGGILFKAFLFMSLGEATYNQRVSILESGTPVEMVGAFVMKADPATLWIVEQIESLLP